MDAYYVCVETIPIAEIRAHVARIGASPGFANSARLRELLGHTVTETLAGRSESLKESVLGVTVFGRKPGYDSDANSIVRVEFARLRKKLEQYYQLAGANETLRVVFPRGNGGQPELSSPPSHRQNSRPRRSRFSFPGALASPKTCQLVRRALTTKFNKLLSKNPNPVRRVNLGSARPSRKCPFSEFFR